MQAPTQHQVGERGLFVTQHTDGWLQEVERGKREEVPVKRAATTGERRKARSRAAWTVRRQGQDHAIH